MNLSELGNAFVPIEHLRIAQNQQKSFEAKDGVLLFLHLFGASNQFHQLGITTVVNRLGEV